MQQVLKTIALKDYLTQFNHAIYLMLLCAYNFCNSKVWWKISKVIIWIDPVDFGERGGVAYSVSANKAFMKHISSVFIFMQGSRNCGWSKQL